MAKAKLLHVLIIMQLLTCVYRALADDGSPKHEDRGFAKDLSQDAIKMTWQNLRNIAAKENIYTGSRDYNEQAERGDLMIFLSSSMPLGLLQAYALEAKHYGGRLIFKGLPEGNFKALSKLVMDIEQKCEDCPMQIDDEAFEKYEVNLVPCIVLSSDKDCMPWQSCKSIYDKVTGNISIHAALEKFNKSGELASLAAEILQK